MRKLPDSSALILQGGDERIALIEGASHNKYFVEPHPCRDRIEFSSSTASHVSVEAYGEIERFRERLNAALDTMPVERLHAQEYARLRQEFFRIWGLNEADTVWRLAASGTDAHADAARLCLTHFDKPFRIVMPEFCETGTHVRAALLRGSERAGRALADVLEIAIRNPDGSPRAAADIDQDFHREVSAAWQQDMPVLLVRYDESKSGCVAPGMALIERLRAAAPDRLAVLVDASQLRIGREKLQNYLAEGCLVVATGSKFFGAPSFCGALLVPKMFGASAAACFAPPDVHNFGLLARWEAAVYAMRSYFGIAAADRDRITAGFDDAVRRALKTADCIAPIERVASNDGEAMRDEARSLHALRLFHPGENRCLEPAEVSAAYLHLLNQRQADGQTYALGQPVPCGGPHGGRTQYLRISLSAPEIIGLSRLAPAESVARLEQKVFACLHALNAIVRNMQ